MKTAFNCLLIILVLLFSMQAKTASVLPLDLNSLYESAEYIFHGQCIEIHETEDPSTNLPATFTMFRVLQVVKGELTDTFTIKQFGGSSSAGGATIKIPGTPRFEMGKEYVVFLPAASQLGFSSPVGLSQGVFNIMLDQQGKTAVSSGRDFAELITNMPSVQSDEKVLGQSTQTSQPNLVTTKPTIGSSMLLDDFLLLIKAMEKQP